MSKKKKKQGAKKGQSQGAIPKKQSKAIPKTAATPPTIDSSDLASFWSNKNLHLLLVFLVSFGIYANTLSHQYAVDDSIVILRNNYTKKGLKGMKGIWTEDTFTGFFGKKKNLVAGGRYRPLSVATFALELQLFGSTIVDNNGKPILDADGDVNYTGSPFLSHLINVLLYALLCIVIYLMLLQMFNPRGEQDNFKGYFIALAGALLYAAHPIHTEAVANIKGRDEIMVLLGGVLTVYWLLRATMEQHKVENHTYLEGDKTLQEKHFLYSLLAIGAFVFAIFSKENAITFLAIIPAALYFFTPLTIDKIVLRTLPFIGIALFFWFAIRGVILGEAATVSTSAPMVELMNDPFLKLDKAGNYIKYTNEERIATVFYTWLDYIQLLVYPETLTNDYYPKHIRTDKDLIPTYQMGYVILSLLVHLAMVGFAIFGTIKRKPYAFFILFYFATFSVVSNLIFPIGSNMAERFMFLPSVGFSALCALGLYHLIDRQVLRLTPLVNALRLPTVLLVIVVGLYGYKTFDRNFAWKDDFTLFTTDIANSPNSAKLNNAVSGVLQEYSHRISSLSVKRDTLRSALQHSITATKLHPTYNNAWLLQGNANVMLGNVTERIAEQNTSQQERQQLFEQSLQYYTQAIAAYQKVLVLRNDHPDIRRNIAVAYRDQGKILGQRRNDIAGSIAALSKSIEYAPSSDMETLRLLGVANGIRGMQLQQSNQLDAATQAHHLALDYFLQAAELAPNNLPIMYNIEIAYSVLNLPEKAAEYTAKRMAIDPNYDPRKGNDAPLEGPSISLAPVDVNAANAAGNKEPTK